MTVNDTESSLIFNNTPESSYIPINPTGHAPIGNITLISITKLGVAQTAILASAIAENRISFTYLGYKFLGVQKVASNETMNWASNQGYMTIRVNETARFIYWYNYTQKEVSLISELKGGIIREVTVNGTQIPLENITTFNGGFFYNFSDYYKLNRNGTLNMGFVFDYNLTISNWLLSQHDMTSLLGKTYLTKKSQIIDAYYNYSLSPGASGLNMTGKFIINLPDVTKLNQTSINMSIYSGDIHSPSISSYYTSYTKHANYSIEFTDNANGTKYAINFKTNFTIEFKNPAEPNLWSRESLYQNRDIRKREYELKIVEGPSTIPVSLFYFNESTIPYDDGIILTSELGRPVSNMNMNYTSSAAGPVGTTFQFVKISETNYYYLVYGETDRISLYYKSKYTLNLVIADKAQIPIQNVKLVVYYQDVPYGSVITSTEVYQLAPQYTDSLGQVVINEVPYGNFTLGVYYYNNFIQNISASSSISLNFLVTEIPHFPTWIIIYASISLVFVLSGLKIYKKNSRS
jgi:hypothetical protein